MSVYWSSFLGTRLGPTRQQWWARDVQNHCYLHKKPLQSILTCENKYSTDTPDMDVNGTSLAPREQERNACLFSALLLGKHHQNNWNWNYNHTDASDPSPIFSVRKQDEGEFPMYLIFSLCALRERKYEMHWSTKDIVPINLLQNRGRYSVYWGKLLHGKWWCRIMYHGYSTLRNFKHKYV